MLYYINLISAIHQYELAICIHMSPPSWTFLSPPTLSHPSRLLQHPGLSFLTHTTNFHWLYFTYGSAYVSMLLSPFVSCEFDVNSSLNIFDIIHHISSLILCCFLFLFLFVEIYFNPFTCKSIRIFSFFLESVSVVCVF